MANVSLSDLRAALDDADYPAHKDDLVRRAEASNASEAAQKALRSLPPVDYASFDEVVRSVSPDVGSGPTEAQRSDPDRRTGEPHVADHLR